ncbi:uncharacterized protein LOC120140877 [Hibiscus syriacus]|uniref:uncharacterized protein LOC120140877 n=1 Tax=Hibiscus syriacus TaxID=106335 RepID=UPI001923414E|nr:uncharacterized protein LOC120140877 [Hibiscus syriacus]
MSAFGFLKEKLAARVMGWMKRLLSYGGPEVFLKSIAQEACLGFRPCPVCQADEETAAHALRGCLYAQEAGFSGVPRFTPGESSLSWVEALSQLFTVEHFTNFAVLLWNIWNGRNTLVHEDKLQPMWLIALNAQVLQNAFKSARNSTIQGATRTTVGVPLQQVPTSVAQQKWRSPDSGVVKVNVDGTFNP